MNSASAPRPHELEISVFGRGFGEAVLIHVGDGSWISVDSLRDRNGTVSPLRYLAEIGVDPSAGIRHIVATHWHDDHVSGLADIYEIAKSAHLTMPAAMNRPEVMAFIAEASQAHFEKFSSGVQELSKVARVQKSAGRPKIQLAVPNRALIRFAEDELSHKRPCCLEALSPCDGDIAGFIAAIASRAAAKPGQRAVPFSPNDVSVALWLTLGEHRVLLGADLEDHESQMRGWKAVLKSPARPAGQANVFKVPHHGSRNAHNDHVWDCLLEKGTIAALTEWNRGRKLPTTDDVSRILTYTPNAFISSGVTGRGTPRPAVVSRALRRQSVTLRQAPDRAGQVRMRIDLQCPDPTWEVELIGSARHLRDLH